MYCIRMYGICRCVMARQLQRSVSDLILSQYQEGARRSTPRSHGNRIGEESHRQGAISDAVIGGRKPRWQKAVLARNRAGKGLFRTRYFFSRELRWPETMVVGHLVGENSCRQGTIWAGASEWGVVLMLLWESSPTCSLCCLLPSVSSRTGFLLAGV